MLLITFAADKSIYLQGRVKESFAKTDLTHARVYIQDAEGIIKDSVRANKGLTWRAGMMDTTSYFSFEVPRIDSTYTFEVVCEGYKPVTFNYTLDKIGKREKGRDMGIIYLEKGPVMLREVTVTSSKIKFYNDGDTMVYNADAFQLAEGSMLDALIAQLPGVELNTDGQIKVNGEFIESLLLDGKKFFDGNNNLMLENIAAYTVKDIKVYEAPTKEDTHQGNLQNKVLTMNVQLKKEYNIGWLVNAQGGYGTKDRYLGRLFASWFNPTTRISLAGNVNNLNSNKAPGRDDTWTPDQLPDGTKQNAMFGISYNYEHPEDKYDADGAVTLKTSINNVDEVTNRINFLPGGDTYEDSYGHSHTRQLSFITNHYLSMKASKSVRLGASVTASYDYSKFNSENLSAAFSKDPGEMSREMLDAIYSNGSPELLETILNRAKTQSDSWNKRYGLYLSPYFSLRLPKSNDYLMFGASVRYNSLKEEIWRNYDINYGASYFNPELLRQYTDNSPNHDFSAVGHMSYRTFTEHINFFVRYQYQFMESAKDSYTYALDRLSEMGVYGILPADYVLAFDPKNSYMSRSFYNEHTLVPEFSYFTTFKNQNRLQINVNPHIDLIHRKLNYKSDNKDYRLSRTDVAVSFSGYWDGMIQFDFNASGNGRQNKYRNSLRYSYSLTPTLPDLFDMVDVVNNANPLNIYIGNPDLKTAWRHRHLFRWQYTPLSHPTFYNMLYFSYTHAKNSLVRGYNYDSTTGIRWNKMYNVNGNYTWALTNELSWQFGSKKQFTFTSMTDGIIATYNDMIGVDMESPQNVTVKNNTLTENIKLGWQIGSQNLSLRCDFTTRHTSSEQPGFNTINATHVNYGISGNFILPAGFGISTDFMCYTRRGYGMRYLDTTDAVWNMRLSYAPPKNKHWVFMVDGFDMLHQLSNVNYAVTASGRTVSYTNTIPRYVMLSIQYRLNIQPKKR